MEFQIRKSESSDIPQILAMIREFAELENLSTYCEVTAESLHESLFGENAFVEGLIVLADETPIGYALFSLILLRFAGNGDFIWKIFSSKKSFAGSVWVKKLFGKLPKLEWKEVLSELIFRF